MDNGRRLTTAVVLLVEDSLADVRLMREVLHEDGVACELHVAEDGEEALAFLRQEGGYSGAPRPDLILLDLNLPGKDGREVLMEIKQDPQLKRIPVVVLTASQAEQDVVSSYELHANCYITKPVGLRRFIHVVRSIKDFWFAVATLPEDASRE